MPASGTDAAAVYRELGVLEQTYCRWRNQYGGLEAEDPKRLEELKRTERHTQGLHRCRPRRGVEGGLQKHPRWSYQRAYYGICDEGWHGTFAPNGVWTADFQLDVDEYAQGCIDGLVKHSTTNN